MTKTCSTKREQLVNKNQKCDETGWTKHERLTTKNHSDENGLDTRRIAHHHKKHKKIKCDQNRFDHFGTTHQNKKSDQNRFVQTQTTHKKNSTV